MTASGKVRSNGRKSYNHPCLIAQALDVLGDRWTLLILRDLMAGLHRYSDILESCVGMSPNVLSDRLKKLEAEGLVERHYERGLPPRVEYTLTEKGWAVRPILLALIEWGLRYQTRFPIESVGDEVPTDFAVRVVPTFAFRPEYANGLDVTLVIEISDCTDCNAWTFQIRDGRLLPSRNGVAEPDIRLRTNTEGFFRFVRGHADPCDCGELEGPPEVARAIQACFSPV